MRLINTAAIHAVPVIKERMAIVDAAEEKCVEPKLPVGLIFSSSLEASKLTRMF